MDDIQSSKEELRKKYLGLRDSLDALELADTDEEICSRITRSDFFSRASKILAYCPFGSETDIGYALKKALEDGKKVYYPRCVKGRRMEFFTPGPGGLRPGKFGISEPDGSGEKFLPSADGSDLIIVPGLIYDRSGYRIGYGGGYYDRFLPSFGGVSAGVCRDVFLIDRVPRGDFDVHVDMLYTEREEIPAGYTGLWNRKDGCPSSAA